MKLKAIVGVLVCLLLTSVFVFVLDADEDCYCYCDNHVIYRCGQICQSRGAFCTTFYIIRSECGISSSECYQRWEARCDMGPGFTIGCSRTCSMCGSSHGGGDVFWQ